MTARFVFAAVSVIAFSTVLAGSASSQIAPPAADALAELEAQQQPVPPTPPPARGTQPRPGPAPQPNVIPPPVGQPRPTPSTAPAPPPRPPGQLVNVKVDLTITDQRSGAPPVKKTVSVMAADMELSRIRSISQFTPGTPGPVLFNDVPLNVDVLPRVEQGGKVRLMITLQYDLPAPPGDGKERGPVLLKTGISETLNVIVDDGKPLVVAQSADPVSDRQVTIEVRATILK